MCHRKLFIGYEMDGLCLCKFGDKRKQKETENKKT